MRNVLVDIVNIVSKYTSDFELITFGSGRIKLELEDKNDITCIEKDLKDFNIEIC